ncbi:c-type cytochrome [Acidovorax soli]|uniref:Cytochrome c, mono-and diheme variants n=1 Tax=Acidovorax soli TaxID=592050 RepID=A0A1H4B218_9BURK|nr:cytochrome c [Acidovorax soli]SEA42136.1 Cytochrome c, mono-and diheme variants [Acidovorax soli]
MHSTLLRRWAGLGAVLCLSLIALDTLAQTPAAAPTNLIERGRYLATAGDCIACHTAPGGAAMAGGLAIATPLGAIYSTNITPSQTMGIGHYTLEQFTAALRHGRRADGAHLYPAMPYTAYAKVTDEDMAALYAYFMQGVKPVDSAPPATALPFPFNIRASMAAWNTLFHDPTPFRGSAQQPPEWNRGAYLVQGLAHCSTCHTPRNTFMAENMKRALGGGEVGPWHAPNISSDPQSGIGQWSAEELVRYLRVGHAAGKDTAAGPMAEAVDHSLSQLTDADLHAMAAYLKTTAPVADTAAQQPAFSWGKASDQLASIRGVALPKDLGTMTGPQLYDAYCASCHQAQAQGSFDGKLPALFHNSTLGRNSTNNLVLAILQGVPRHGRDTIMPAFARELSDPQIATLGNYLLKEYGNPNAQVTERQVAQLRGNAQDHKLLLLARVGLAAGALVVLLFLGWAVSRSRGRRSGGPR